MTNQHVYIIAEAGVNHNGRLDLALQLCDAAKAAGPGKFKMGGTGSKSEDQIITVAIEKATGAKFTYLLPHHTPHTGIYRNNHPYIRNNGLR